MLSFGEEKLDVVNRKSLTDLVSGRGDLNKFSDVSSDNFVSFGVAKCIAKDGVNVLNLPRGWRSFAPFTNRAALLSFLRCSS